MGAPAYSPGQAGTQDVSMPAVETDVNETEWEFEYAENETEEFYFTLDLSTHQPEDALKAAIGKRRADRSTASTSSGRVTRRKSSTGPVRSEAIPTQDTLASSNVIKKDQFQVLDLHTTNPLIKFGNELYSSYWSTDFGTQFYLSRRGVSHTPLRSGHALDVIGVSRARLVGQPAILSKRNHFDDKETAGASTSNAIQIPSDDDVNSPGVPPVDAPLRDRSSRIEDVRRQSKDPEVRAQASFLQRLTGIKRRRGENDIVPIHGVKNYATLSDSRKDELRESASTGEVAGRDAMTSLGEERMAEKQRPKPINPSAHSGGPNGSSEDPITATRVARIISPEKIVSAIPSTTSQPLRSTPAQPDAAGEDIDPITVPSTTRVEHAVDSDEPAMGHDAIETMDVDIEHPTPNNQQSTDGSFDIT